MTRPEMNRRLDELTNEQFARALKMHRDGFGARGMSLEGPVTLKQANAVFAWVYRYGYINARGA